MKKIISIIALSTFGSLVWCQSEKHEFYVTAGIGTVPFLVESFNHNFLASETYPEHANPAITAGYQYRISKKINLGPELVIDKFWFEGWEDHYRFTSLLGRCNIILHESMKTKVYSGISAGVAFRNAIETSNGIIDERHDTYLALHLYLISVDFKLRKFSITTNTGLGVSGLVNLGIKYHF